MLNISFVELVLTSKKLLSREFSLTCPWLLAHTAATSQHFATRHHDASRSAAVGGAMLPVPCGRRLLWRRRWESDSAGMHKGRDQTNKSKRRDAHSLQLLLRTDPVQSDVHPSSPALPYSTCYDLHMRFCCQSQSFRGVSRLSGRAPACPLRPWSWTSSQVPRCRAEIELHNFASRQVLEWARRSCFAKEPSPQEERREECVTYATCRQSFSGHAAPGLHTGPGRRQYHPGATTRSGDVVPKVASKDGSLSPFLVWLSRSQTRS